MKKIVLDEDSFNAASQKLEQLAIDIETLKADMDVALVELDQGFQTPAGQKFMLLCWNKVLQPLQDQAHVIKHVSGNLQAAKSSYQSVFQEYRNLNEEFKNL